MFENCWSIEVFYSSDTVDRISIEIGRLSRVLRAVTYILRNIIKGVCIILLIIYQSYVFTM